LLTINNQFCKENLMKNLSTTIKTLTCTVFILALSSLAQAQATRTWVSGVGADDNPCSRTAPCKTFAGAISKTADGGEIDAVDPGGFGTVTITKSITLDGTGTNASILSALTTGVNVNDAAAASGPGTKVVVIRNISIQGAGSGYVGVSITSAKSVFVEGVAISGMALGTGRGISDTRTVTGGSLYVNNSDIRNNTGSGIVVSPSSGTPTLQATINNVRLEQNGSGGLGTGFVIAGSNVRGTISHSVISKSPSFGLQSDLNSKMNVDQCWIAYNNAGVDAAGGSEMRLSNSVVTFNTTSNTSGNVKSYGNNMVRGNGTDNTPAVEGPQ
jgi:hypothetical protein